MPLQELGDFEKNKNKAVHKYNAYKKAARSVMDHPVKITSGSYAIKNLVTKNALTSLVKIDEIVFFFFQKGIGKQISTKIDEYLKIGRISKLEKVTK